MSAIPSPNPNLNPNPVMRIGAGEVSKWCVNHRFPLVPPSDADQVVGIPDVEFGEHRGNMEWGEAELMSGKGYLFFTVMLFSPRKSMHNLSDPSFLFTK